MSDQRAQELMNAGMSQAAATTIASAEATAGGGVQTVRLLGPYSVAFDARGLINPEGYGVELADLSAGSIAIPWVVNPGAPWAVPDGTTTCYANIGIGSSDGADYLGTWDLRTSLSRDHSQPEAEIPVGGIIGDVVAALPRKAVVVGTQKLVVAVYTDGDAPTSGSAIIYALIATPAA